MDGTAQIWLKVKDVSMNHGNQRFVIYLEAYRPHGETNNILVAVTNPFTCIRHKLVVSEANNAPYVWYKDEGAKDKAIKVLVKLVDASRAVVSTRVVPLSVSLIYSSGQPVQPSSVLTVFHDRDRPLVITQRGSEIVRFRVNEVSRNHRKQMFHLLVAPDINADPSVGDVSPATSVAFEVKSKRTSDARRRGEVGEDLDEPDESSGDDFADNAAGPGPQQPAKRLRGSADLTPPPYVQTNVHGHVHAHAAQAALAFPHGEMFNPAP
eukprot:gene50808-62141_t